MDKIWYRNPSMYEVIGRCGGDEETELPRRTNKVESWRKYLKRWCKPLVNYTKTNQYVMSVCQE